MLYSYLVFLLDNISKNATMFGVLNDCQVHVHVCLTDFIWPWTHFMFICLSQCGPDFSGFLAKHVLVILILSD